jgi:hypothetical protein
MTGLHTLQTRFQDYLINDSAGMLQHVAEDPRLCAEKRLKIYFDAYRIRLLEILKMDFEKTHTLMGDEQFEKAFHHYLKTHPSEHFSVRYFGQYFPKMLKEVSPFSSVPVFAEMAHFEWSLSHTLDAKDAPIVSHDILSTLDPDKWPTLKLQFHPSVISQRFEWDTAALWLLIDKEEPPRPPEKQPTALRWMFWRKGLRSYFQSCNDYEDNIYAAIENGHDFTAICEGLLDILPEEEVPLKAAQTLNKWVQEELLTL